MRITAFLPVAFLAVASWTLAETAAPVTVTKEKDVAYKTGDALSDYEKERCKLDVYTPQGLKGYATLVWFHGGGLTGGNKNGSPKFAESLVQKGVALVAPNYRLSPKAKYPAYIQDAAAAFAWVKRHIAERGGDPDKVFIGGHSAGGYLTFMLGLDERYLKEVGFDLSSIAGLIPVSGQTMTHYTVRAERGVGQYTITADEAAPVFYCRKNTQPFLVLYADHDMAARAEENMYWLAITKAAGNKAVSGKLITDRTHGSIAGKMVEEGDPAREALLRFVRDPQAKAE